MVFRFVAEKLGVFVIDSFNISFDTLLTETFGAMVCNQRMLMSLRYKILDGLFVDCVANLTQMSFLCQRLLASVCI